MRPRVRFVDARPSAAGDPGARGRRRTSAARFWGAVVTLLLSGALIALTVDAFIADSSNDSADTAHAAAIMPYTSLGETVLSDPPVADEDPDVAVMAASEPVHIRLPSIDVESELMDLGLTSQGELEVPPTAYPAGWFTGAPTPGELGPAIIAGHVDWGSEVGVFYDLHRMSPGDEVFIRRADGTTVVYVVTSVEQYAKNAFPTDTVYGDIDHAGLRLITCGGEFDYSVASHRDNIVVFATVDRVMHGR